jgi:shikimate dehydrogenase
MTSLPGRLTLVGHPVAHSLSPRFQNAALRAAGIDLEYEATDVPPDRLTAFAHELAEVGAAGNVTVPHKESFAACCARLSPIARRTGAVNTFWTEDGSLCGDNTDVGGFDLAVRASVGLPEHPFEMVLLGAGGAASGVLAAAERWGAARVRVWSRTMLRAERLCERYGRFAHAEWSLETAVKGAAFIVNATPIGVTGDDLPVDPAILESGARVFDLVYRRGETPWVLASRAHGHRAADGLGMLVEQGALSFERWFGRAPDRGVMRQALA